MNEIRNDGDVPKSAMEIPFGVRVEYIEGGLEERNAMNCDTDEMRGGVDRDSILRG